MTFAKKAVKFAQEYERLLGHKPSDKTSTGCDFVTQSKYIEVKSYSREKPGYIQIYSSIFKHLNKTVTGHNRYYIYVIYNSTCPKLIIVPPNRIFKGVNTRRLFSMKLGDYWNNLSVNISPKIYKGLKVIDLKSFFSRYGKRI